MSPARVVEPGAASVDERSLRDQLAFHLRPQANPQLCARQDTLSQSFTLLIVYAVLLFLFFYCTGWFYRDVHASTTPISPLDRIVAQDSLVDPGDTGLPVTPWSVNWKAMCYFIFIRRSFRRLPRRLERRSPQPPRRVAADPLR